MGIHVKISDLWRGEAISAKFLARTFASHCDGIVVLDIHAPEAMDNLEVPVELVSAMPEIAEHLREHVQPDFILSPDKGAIDRASSVATAIDVPFSYLEKNVLMHTLLSILRRIWMSKDVL